MMVAGMIAKGTTTITNIEHILRGYENIVDKLSNVGADIDPESIKFIYCTEFLISKKNIQHPMDKKYPIGRLVIQ